MDFLVKFKFAPGDFVNHVVDASARGMVLACQVGAADEYRFFVQWTAERSAWHYPIELKAETQGRPLGFAPETRGPVGYEQP